MLPKEVRKGWERLESIPARFEEENRDGVTVTCAGTEFKLPKDEVKLAPFRYPKGGVVE